MLSSNQVQEQRSTKDCPISPELERGLNPVQLLNKGLLYFSDCEDPSYPWNMPTIYLVSYQFTMLAVFYTRPASLLQGDSVSRVERGEINLAVLVKWFERHGHKEFEQRPE
jgi:hypothetical protein